MIQLFKRANDKSGSEKAGEGKTKWNGESLFVKVDNEFVSLSELAKTAKENDYVALPEKVENEMEIDGETHDISDLVFRYQTKKKKNMTDKEDPALQAAKKGMPKLNKDMDKDEEDDEKENEIAGAKDNPDEVEDKAKKMSSKKKNKDEEDEDMKENEEEEVEKEKENKKSEEDDVEEKIARTNGNGKKNTRDVSHFVRLNTARENGLIADTLTIDTMHSRIDRGRSNYGSNR